MPNSILAMYETEKKYEDEFDKNLIDCKSEFISLFSDNDFDQKNLVSVCAPGRVNIIGEHIDYNDGFVLPMAIPLYTVIVGALNKSENRICRIKSLESTLINNGYVEFSLDDLKSSIKPGSWSNYVIGVVACFKGTLKPFDAVIKSNVPLGSGLSSSAALEVSVYTFLENIFKNFSSKQEKALACQKAEHEYASVPCGIMDQFISSMGIKGSALLIDCKSYKTTAFPLNDPSVVFLVINSNVKHQLEGSEYSERRKQCEKVVKIMNKKSMRDANLEDLEGIRNLIDDLEYKRGKHAITEIKRTLDATKALKESDLKTLGSLMNQSHDSLRDDFDVSCKELDSLVEIARSTVGVYGSRMTGGGFGGCTVTLVSKANVFNLIKNIQDKYQGNPSFYVCSPCEGARLVAN